mmetsp:Transcript_30281/g.81388  ORF Transcript_30281/g.81388 Transcript_30281/m.81388 type:complete len:555 (-) Transcript_30281:281-1945(-)
MPTADEHKALGNEAFKAQKYEEAIKHFSDAIDADPSGHVLYSNRSAAYASLGKFEDALADADKCIQINGTWAKGYSRKGAALSGMRKYEDAAATYEEGLTHDAENAALKQGLQEVRAKLEDAAGMGGIGNLFGDPAIFAKIAGNPSTAQFLSQPDFIQKINDLQRDPSTLNLHLQDPRVMQVMGMLMGVNVQTGSEFAGGEEPPKSKEPEPEPEPMEEELTEEEKAARELKKQADAHKDEGNTAYKAKKFEEAIAHYSKAREVLPTEMTYLNNIAAVYFEQNDYDKCVEACQEAISLGRENRADYRNIAKAYARMGNAMNKKGQLEEAIKAYEDSMLENRTEDVEKRLKQAKKTLQTERAKAYVNEDLSVQERERGNALFKEGKYPQALEAYSEAMKRNPADHVPYSNRAAAYQKLMEWQLALKDCDKCIEMCPTFTKAWTRKGGLHYHLKEFHKALDAYKMALSLDESNEEAKHGVETTINAINMGSSEEDQRARAQRAMADPEIQAILNDHNMRKVLQEMQEDPKSMSKFMADPSIKSNIEKLVAAGVLSVK